MPSRLTVAEVLSAAFHRALVVETREPARPSYWETARVAARLAGEQDLEQIARHWVIQWIEWGPVTRRWYGATADLPWLSARAQREVVARAKELWERVVVEHQRTRLALSPHTRHEASGPGTQP